MPIEDFEEDEVVTMAKQNYKNIFPAKKFDTKRELTHNSQTHWRTCARVEISNLALTARI